MNNIHNYTSYIYIIIAFLTSGYALTTTNLSSAIYLTCAVGIAIFLFEATLTKKLIDASKAKISLGIIFFTVCPALLNLITNATSQNTYGLLKLILVIFFSAVLFISFDFKYISKIFANFIFYICIISIIGYALENLTDATSSLPVIRNSNDVPYKIFIIFFSFDGFLKYRNIGVFWEPGIFASMIYGALIADLYSQQKVSTFRTLIFLITLFTTFSGASLVLFTIYILLVVFQPSKDGRHNAYSQILILFMIISICYIIGLYLSNAEPENFSYFERLTGKIIDPEDTQSSRIISPLISLDLFMEKPVLGWGISSSLEEIRFIKDDLALTATSAYLLSALGIFGITFTLIPIVGIAKIHNINITSKILLIISYVFIINKEPHVYFTLTHAIIFFSMASTLKLKKYI